MAPKYHVIEQDNDCQDRATRQSATPPRRSTWLINTRWPGNISLQAIHHVMALEAAKVSTQLQQTGPLVDIEDYCFGNVPPITKKTITHYHKLQHDPDLKDLWVPAMSK
jgi:hypothetical protein